MIHYKAEGRLHKFEWVYDGTAWDVESGTSVKDKHHRSTQGAIENAVKRLIEELRARKICLKKEIGGSATFLTRFYFQCAIYDYAFFKNQLCDVILLSK